MRVYIITEYLIYNTRVIFFIIKGKIPQDMKKRTILFREKLRILSSCIVWYSGTVPMMFYR